MPSELASSKVKSVMDSLPRHRQNLLFSATIPPKIERLADEILTNPLFVSVGKVGYAIHPPIHAFVFSPVLQALLLGIQLNGWKRVLKSKDYSPF